jgi:hypothetical protein
MPWTEDAVSKFREKPNPTDIQLEIHVVSSPIAICSQSVLAGVVSGPTFSTET